QAVGVGDTEQRRPRALTGVDERSDVGVALGDDAVERSQHSLERFHVAQTCDVRGSRLYGGFLGRGVARTLFGILLRYRLGRQQALPAQIGRVSELIVCLGDRQVGLCLTELLIDLRRVDLSEQLT